jgi:putative ABC transport system permease protein
MSTIGSELGPALRSFFIRPAFSALAVLTLGLGIGATTSMFSVLYGVLLRPLPYPEVEELVRLQCFEAALGSSSWSAANFVDLGRQTSSFEVVAGFRTTDYAQQGELYPEMIKGATVTSGFFQVLGMPALHGRSLSVAADAPGSERTVVLSHGFWQSRFAGDEGVVGGGLELEGESYTVVGIMPAELDFPAGTQVWVASRFSVPEPPIDLGEDPAANRGADYFSAIGRLKQGISVEQARSELILFGSALEAAHPETNTGESFGMEPLTENQLGEVRPLLMALFAAVGLVLLIAIVNVANLMLARATERSHEMAVRGALGAGRLRIARQLLAESLLLALAGGLVGIALALGSMDALIALAPDDLPRIDEVSVNLPVLGFSLVVSLLSGIVFGMVPAFWLSRRDPGAALNKSTERTVAGGGFGRTRAVLVVVEIAVSLTLLVGAGLLARTLLELSAVDPGFSARQAVTAQVSLPGTQQRDNDEVRAFHNEVLEKARALPGVTSVGAVLSLPIDSTVNASLSFNIYGRDFADGEQPVAGYQAASPGYFETIGIPVLDGRSFTTEDNADGAPVAIVSNGFARKFFPGEQAVGQRISWRDPESEGFQWSTIVGVVGDTRHKGPDSELRVEAYQPYAQAPWPWISLVIATEAAPASLIEPLRSAVMEIRSGQPVEEIRTLETILSESLAERRAHLILLSSYAVVALVLASVGLFAVMSFSVSRQAREIGIRMAIGASAGRVLSEVLGQGALLVAVGLGSGALAALLLGRFMAGFLFQVDATDPAAFAIACGSLTLVALLACAVPAWRAAHTNPASSLRAE